MGIEIKRFNNNTGLCEVMINGKPMGGVVQIDVGEAVVKWLKSAWPELLQTIQR